MTDGAASAGGPNSPAPTGAGGGDASRALFSRSSGSPGFGVPPAEPRRKSKAVFVALPLVLLAGVLLLFLLPGCETRVKVDYGSRQPLREGDESINGTGVLSEMLTRAGHRVSSATRLTPRLGHSADVIVWFIQDYTPPSQAAADWLEDWLEEKEGRTLIVVGRDFDAEPLYWSKVTPQASPQQATTVTMQGTLAALRFSTERTATAPQPEDWRWFTLDRSASLTQRGVTTLKGDATWTSGVDPTKVEIELYGRIKPKDPEDEILLETPGDVLVFRRQYDVPYYVRGKLGATSQLIVVTNGSFLLNMPLVNHEHRKLAGALLNEIGDKQRVFFLETKGNPEVLAQDPPPPRVPTSTMYFDVPRIQNLLWHLAALTLIVCFGLFAIHGRPRSAPKPPPSDFGRHAEALGDLLSQTRDAAYAQARLSQYRNSIRAEGGTRRSAK